MTDGAVKVAKTTLANATDFGLYGQYVDGSTTNTQDYYGMHLNQINLDCSMVTNQNLQPQSIQVEQDMQQVL